MKRLFVIAFLIGTASLAHGQAGYVMWQNTASTRVSVDPPSPFPSGVPSLMPVHTNEAFYFALFVAPTSVTTIGGVSSDPTTMGWTFTGILATNGNSIGRLAAEATDPDGQGIQIPGYTAGSEANFAIAGWSGNVGTNWAQAEAWLNGGPPLIGGTNLLYYGVAQQVAEDVYLQPEGGPYNDVMGPYPSISAFTLYAIPESSTFALGALGAVLFVGLRKKVPTVRRIM